LPRENNKRRKYDQKGENMITYVIQINGKIHAKMQVVPDLPKDVLEKLALTHELVKPHLEGKKVRRIIGVPGRLINIITNKEKKRDK
jgi:leucyl-tRNA synthetase